MTAEKFYCQYNYVQTVWSAEAKNQEERSTKGEQTWIDMVQVGRLPVFEEMVLWYIL